MINSVFLLFVVRINVTFPVGVPLTLICFPCFVQRCNAHHQHLPGVSAPPPGERDLRSDVPPQPGLGVRSGQRRSPIQHLRHPQPSARPPAPLHPARLAHGTPSFVHADVRGLRLQEPVLRQLPHVQSGALHSEGGEEEGPAAGEGLREPDGRQRDRPQPQPAGQGEAAGGGRRSGGPSDEPRPHRGAARRAAQVRLPFWARWNEEEPELSSHGWGQHGHESPGAPGVVRAAAGH